MPEFTYTLEDGRSFNTDQELSPTDLDDVIAQTFPDVAIKQARKTNTAEYADPNKPTPEEFALKDQIDSERSISEKAGNIWDAVGSGLLQMKDTVLEGWKEGMDTSIKSGGKGKRIKSISEGTRRGLFDMVEGFQGIGGFLADNFAPTISESGEIGRGYNPEEKLERRRLRWIQDQKDKELRKTDDFLSIMHFPEEEILPKLTEAFAIVNPSTAVGGTLPAKIITQVGSKFKTASTIHKLANDIGTVVDAPAQLLRATGRGLIKGGANVIDSPKTIKVLSSGVDKAETAVKGLWRVGFRSVGHKLGPAVSISKAVGDLTAKKSEQFANVMRVFADPKRQTRFLEEVLMHPNVPASVKRSISIAGAGGQKTLELAFNAVSEGVTTAITQGILASMVSNDPEAIGGGIAGGALFGTPVGAFKKSKSGIGIKEAKGLRRLNPEQRDVLTRMRFDTRNKQTQVELLGNLSKGDQSMIGSLREGLSDMRIILLEPKMFQKHHKDQTGSEADNAPYFEDKDGVLWLDSSHTDITPHLIDNYTNRVADGYIQDRPGVADDMARDFQVDGGTPLITTDGNIINVGGDMGKIVMYNNKNQPSAEHKITGTAEASKKLIEWHTTRFFGESNNGLVNGVKGKHNTTEALRDIAHISLSKLGVADRVTGAPLNKELSKPAEGLSKNESVVRGIANLERLNNQVASNRSKRDADAVSFAKGVNKDLKAKQAEVDAQQRAVHDEAQVEANRIGDEVEANEARALEAMQKETLAGEQDFIKKAEDKVKIKELQDEAEVKRQKSIDKNIIDTHVKEAKKLSNKADRQFKTGEKNTAKSEASNEKLAETISDDMRRINAEVGVDKIVTKDGIAVKVDGKQVPSKQRAKFLKEKTDINQAMEGNHGEDNTVRISTTDSGKRMLFEGMKLGKVKNELSGRPLKIAKVIEKSMLDGDNVVIKGASIESTRFKLKDKIHADGQTRPDPKNPGHNRKVKVFESKPIAGEYAPIVHSGGLSMDNPFTRYNAQAFDVGALRLRDISPSDRKAGIAEIRDLVNQGEQFRNIIKDEKLAETNKVVKAHQDDMERRASDKSETDTRPFVLKSLDPFNIAEINVISK